MAEENGYALFIYSSGMLLVSRLNDPLLEWNAAAGLDAVRLSGFTSKFQDEYGWILSYWRLKSADLRALDLLRCRLGEEAYSRAWKEGQALTLEQAVALAREVRVE